MNRNKIGFIASIFAPCLFLSCNSNQPKNQLFEEFISQLNQINLPYHYNSDEIGFGKQISNKFDEVNFNHGPTTYSHLGYFKSDSGTVHILSINSGDFVQHLIITTFDLLGNKISRNNLSFEDCAGSLPIGFKSCNEVIEIYPNNKIFASLSKIISNSKQQDSLLTANKNFKLWNNGKIIEE